MNSRASVDASNAGSRGKPARSKTDLYDELWDRYQARPDVETRNALIEAYMAIVRREARKVAGALSHVVTAQELESAGTLGLIDSIDGFDPSQGYKFVTFCTPRVRGAMIDELRSWDWTPRATRAKLNKLDRSVRQLEGRLGRAPDEHEIAREMDTSTEEVRKLFSDKNRTLVSLDKCWPDTGGSAPDPPMAILEDRREGDPMRQLQKKEIIEMVRTMLSRTERLVVTLYYYEQLNLREIGHVLSLTESRISQIHSKIVRRLKKRFA